MNNQRIIDIINKPGSINAEESAELEKLIADFPYCQAFRILKAKESHNKHLPDEKEKLIIAALYTSDRSILKNYINSESAVVEKNKTVKKDTPIQTKKRKEKTIAKPQPEDKADIAKTKTAPVKNQGIKTEQVEKTPPKQEKRRPPDPIPQIPEKDIETRKPATEEEKKGLADEMLETLEQYKKIQKEFLDIEDDQEKKATKPKVQEVVPSRAKSLTKASKKEPTKRTDAENIKSKSSIEKQEDPILPATETETKNTTSPLASDSSTSEASFDKSSGKNDFIEVEDTQLIKDHIKRLDRQAVENFRILKQEEQLELIDKFIKTKPDLASNKTGAVSIKEDQEDLSFHSTLFGDDLVTENLANIMIRQRNLESAIDIYKKLIWKFPQKKGYFASQIKKLQEQINKGE